MQQIPDRLHIAPKMADHHIQHIYTKIGVSTRGGRALGDTSRDGVVICSINAGCLTCVAFDAEATK